MQTRVRRLNKNKLDIKNKNVILQMLKAFSHKRNKRDLQDKQSNDMSVEVQDDHFKDFLFPPERVYKFKQVFTFFRKPVSLHSLSRLSSERPDGEPTNRLRQNLEKLGLQLQKKESRINELLHYEYSAKKATEQKTWLQEALEKEKTQVKLLEKENEKHLNELTESRKNAIRFEEELEAAKKQIEELLAENNRLISLIHEKTEESESLTLRNSVNESRCQELDREIVTERALKQEQKEELEALYKQFQTLKYAFESKAEAHEDLEIHLKQSREENDRLKSAFGVCQEEVLTFKQHLAKGMREAKELENRYCEAVSEKIAALTAFHQQQKEFDKQHKELIEAKDKLRKGAEREKEDRTRIGEELFDLKNFNDKLEKRLISLNDEKNALEDKADLLSMKNEVLETERDHLRKTNAELSAGNAIFDERLSEQQESINRNMHDLAVLRSKLEESEEEITALQAQSEENRIRLDEAHQHLAKKVREAALLSEKVEELTLQIADIDHVRQALHETGSKLQVDLEKEEKEKIELAEKVRVLEEEIKKMEERCLHAVHQSRQAEEKIVELEKIEKRHAQLQSLLSGFGSLQGVRFVDEKISDIKAAEKHPPLQFGTPLAEEQSEDTSRIPDEDTKAYPNLFDLPQTRNLPKQTLFD